MLRDMSARDDNPSEVPGKAVCKGGQFIVDFKSTPFEYVSWYRFGKIRNPDHATYQSSLRRRVYWCEAIFRLTAIRCLP